jgi:hypothetical protein
VKVLVVAAIATGFASTASAATRPAVPAFTQHSILKRAPALAYVPARLPVGYRYHRWWYATSPEPVVRIWFRNRAGKELVFIASRAKGDCAAGREKTLQMGGNKVYWSHTESEQQAWRCVNGVRLTVATPQPPDRFGDSGLGRVAASGHEIRS